ncbi:MAG: arabinose efflux permease family protein [Planctomycetota bacterium]|nr:arabinose efflux permease family protein [Planctomycetota bacterium]
MHFESTPVNPLDPDGGPWYRGLTRYHWFVLMVAALGWMFDTMDQQLFNLARKPAMEELLKAKSLDPSVARAMVSTYGGYATSIFMIGWALGGLFFGIMGDKVGRAKTMLLTILVYSIFTGLSALSVGFADFALYRFLTGLGVGGEFAVGVALVAEIMPDRARPYALGWLQASSAIGNMTAALIAILLGRMQESGMIGGDWSAWRIMFLVGTFPALLAILIRRKLKEPERWKAVARSGEISPEPDKKLGSISELFGDPRWRKNAIVGMILGFSGVVGLWGIGFFSFDLIRAVFKKDLEAQGLSSKLIDGRLTTLAGLTSLFQNLGGFFGVYAFTRFTGKLGRRPAFAVSFLLAMSATAWTFWSINRYDQLFWMIPIMGFCQLTLFGGYAIYFPELFPTRLRSTGTSFCYNVGRLVAASGPLVLGWLTSGFIAEHGEIDARRYAGVMMCSVFVIGLLALPFAPETKGKPLPE